MIDLAQQQLIDNIDAHIRQTIAVKDICSSYKLGNIYVIERGSYKDIERNHLGEPCKYQVILISPMGIPFLQRLSSTGKPAGGEILVPSEVDGLRYLRLGHIADTSWRFIQDPDQLDAILLQQEYDPMRQYKEKLRLKSEIDKYNKSILVPTSYYNSKVYLSFFKSLKQGDKFWTSVERQYIVYEPASKRHNKWAFTLLDLNQQQQKYLLIDFANKRVYKDRPRSFVKELDNEKV